MIIEEFKNLKQIDDKNNPFDNIYELESGEIFYIEPVFYTQMRGFKEQFPKEYHRIVEKILELVKLKKKVVFTGNFEFPLTNIEGFSFLEITDVTDPLKIFAEDKSRGSDYGD